MRLVGTMQVYNELERGNLRRACAHLNEICDDFIVYDDGSDDGSAEFAKRQGAHVIDGGENDFLNETTHRDQMLQLAIEHYDADYVLYLDADEIFDRPATEGGLRMLMLTEKSYRFDKVTLWRSECWERTDYLYRPSFVHLWRVHEGMAIPHKHGLHHRPYPDGLTIETAPYLILHFGYATQEAIERRWRERTRCGVPVEKRARSIDESAMELAPVPPEWFPKSWPQQAGPKPEPIRYSEDIMREAGLCD